MFSQASVILSTAEACMAKEGMCGKEGACMAKWGMSGERSMYGEGGHVWCGRGHAWQRAACVARGHGWHGGMHGKGGVCARGMHG